VAYGIDGDGACKQSDLGGGSQDSDGAAVRGQRRLEDTDDGQRSGGGMGIQCSPVSRWRQAGVSQSENFEVFAALLL
jgi:hypothetical protein